LLVVHASDIHLDSPLVGLEAYDGCPREALRGATRRALANLVGVAIEEQASLLLIAGDLYDGSWKDYSTGLYFVSQMRRLREAGIAVVLLRGNHDAESQITKNLNLPDNVRELSTQAPETFELSELGVAIHGQGYAVRDVRDDLARSYPPARAGLLNVGLLHTALGGRPGHETYAPTTQHVLEDKGYDYWALGHVHRSEIVSRAPYVVYSGNLQGRHVRETGAKGFYLLTVDSGRVTGLEARHVDVVRWSDLSIVAKDEDGLPEVLEAVESSLAQAMKDAEGRLCAARLTVSGATRAHGELMKSPDAFLAEVRALALDVGGEGLWVGDVRTTTRTRVDLQSLEGSNDPIALLARAAEEAGRDENVARELVATLEELVTKLPEELRNDPAFAFLDDPKQLADVLGDVEELLLGRLLASPETKAP